MRFNCLLFFSAALEHDEATAISWESHPEETIGWVVIDTGVKQETLEKDTLRVIRSGMGLSCVFINVEQLAATDSLRHGNVRSCLSFPFLCLLFFKGNRATSINSQRYYCIFLSGEHQAVAVISAVRKYICAAACGLGSASVHAFLWQRLDAGKVNRAGSGIGMLKHQISVSGY